MNKKKAETGKPLLSIVTIVLNGERFLEETILSVVSQTYENFEYIVIDGDSTDKTLDIIKKYQSQIDHWISEPDKGMYDAINKGLRLASGDILAYINYDDVYADTEVFNKVISYFNSNREKGWVFSDYDVIDSESQLMYSYKVPRCIVNFKMLGSSDFSYISQPTTFWKREVYQKNGGFNADLRMAADFEFFLRACHSFPVGKLPFKVAKVRFHQETQTHRFRNTNEEEILKIKKKVGVHIINGLFFYKKLALLIYKASNILTYCKRIIRKRLLNEHRS